MQSKFFHRRIRRIQSPHANPRRAVRMETTTATAIVAQNSPGVFSATSNLYGSYRKPAGSKYAKYAMPNTQFRAPGDIKKFAKGHCTARKLRTNNGPEAAASFHLPHFPPLLHSSRFRTIVCSELS